MLIDYVEVPLSSPHPFMTNAIAPFGLSKNPNFKQHFQRMVIFRNNKGNKFQPPELNVGKILMTYL